MQYWNKFVSKIPTHLTVQLRMMLISMAILMLLRILFFSVHSASFINVSLSDWLVSIFFDAMTVCIAFLPFSIIHLLPLPIHNNTVYRIFCRLYFIAVQFSLLLFNLIDLEYFNFTNKRSTYDVFAMATSGSDFSQLIGLFLIEFWWIVVIFIFALVAIDRWFMKWVMPKIRVLRFQFLPQLVSLLILAPIVVIIGRGGVQLRPMGTLEAVTFTNPANTALVLNSAFTIVKSYGEKGIDVKNYFSETEATHLFNPIQTSQPNKLFKENPNIVFIILESFGDEWIKSANPKLTQSYTPFFDSLTDQSWSFTNGYANGKKSIEAVPAIIAGLPSLMNNPYITSQYIDNEVNALPEILKNHNYTSAFFHGATNGSMRFDSFASYAGFDAYYGRTEYGNDKHFDKTWGISDEFFNPWSARKMSTLKTPFFSTLFTLSSHHPYYVPQNRMKDIVNGKSKVGTAISYADFSLRLFFEEAKKQPWYNNTVFVLCADHTASPVDPAFHERFLIYRIPILIYSPSGILPIKKDEKILQQADLFPTVLDMLKTPTNYYAFGQSAYSNKEHFAISYLDGVYYYFCGNYMLEFVDNKVVQIIDIQTGIPLSTEEKTNQKKEWIGKENQLKAIIQRYNHDILNNQTKTK